MHREAAAKTKKLLAKPQKNYSSGDDRTRTDAPRVANAMLSQLSYVPPHNIQKEWAYLDSN